MKLGAAVLREVPERVGAAPTKRLFTVEQIGAVFRGAPWCAKIPVYRRLCGRGGRLDAGCVRRG